jgi:flagellar basal-body rod protein FlgG
VRRGYLESSSVQASEEMVRMIETSKAFSLNSRVVQTADELEKVVNQLR